MKRIKRWFTLELIEEGWCYPRWYLPLYRDYDRRATVCYPIWCWLPAAIWFITWGVLKHVAYDMYCLIQELDLMQRNRKRKGSLKEWPK